MKSDSFFTRMIPILVFIVTILYIVLSFFRGVTNPYQLVSVYTDLAEDSLSVNAWAFRDEIPLTSTGGLVSYAFDEGDKVAQNQLLAYAYRDQTALEQQRFLTQLQTQTKQINFALAETSPVGSPLDLDILNTYVDLQRSATAGNFSRLTQQSEHYKELVLRREVLSHTNTAAELVEANAIIGLELTAAQLDTGDTTTAIYAPKAGIFSMGVDGYETLFSPATLSDLTPSALRTMTAQAPLTDTMALGKLVTNFTWHLVCIIPEESLPLVQKQSRVLVRSSALADAFSMEITNIGYVENGEAVVQLSSNERTQEILHLREQTISLVFRSDEGIRIPKTALRVQDDGEAGVFTATGSLAEFKPVTVIADDGNDYIVKANPKNKEDTRILRSGDAIVLSAEAIYDGKVVH